MNTKPRVLIVATHPIQYQVPWFQYLHQKTNDYEFQVLYLMMPDIDQQGIGFGEKFTWDIPLLEGYNWSQVEQSNLVEEARLDGFMSIRLKNSAQLIKTIKPDVVLITGWQSIALIQILICCKLQKIPTIIRGESNGLKPRNLKQRLLHRLLVNQYDAALCIGQANRSFYLQNNFNPEWLFDAPYFVDNKRFSEQAQLAKKNYNEIRKNWNIPQNSICFCYSGKLINKKRILDILQALTKTQHKNIHLLVVGSGDLMQAATDFTDKHQLPVTFTGFLNQTRISQAYAVSDCLILASDYDETWGLVANEAMACGLPVIASNRCGCHLDLIIQGSTGYSYEFANIKALANTMDKFAAQNQHTRQQMGMNSQQHIQQGYSIKIASNGLFLALNALKPGSPTA